MTLHVQFLTMTSMIAGGFYLGVVLDTFRRLTTNWNKGRFLTYALEILFWLCQMFILYYILFRINSGELRLYVIIACLLGFSIYKAVVATIYIKLLERVIRLVQYIYGHLKKTIKLLVITPIQSIIQLVLFLVIAIIRFIIVGLVVVIRIVFSPIKWGFKLLYSLLPSKIQKKVYKSVKFYSILKTTSMKWLESIMFKRR